MRRTRVILDVDGVVADFVGHTISMLGDLAPPGGRDAFTAWDMVSVMSPEAREVATREWRRQGWCLTMPVLPNAQNAVDRLSLRADVVWATAPMSRAPHWMYERAAWLGRMFAADPDSIVFAHDKSHVWGDVFVDDKPENVDRWASVHRDGVALLWEAPYNLGWTATLPNTRRATRWRDVFDTIQR